MPVSPSPRPLPNGNVTSAAGFHVGGVVAGFKPLDATDLAAIVADAPAATVGAVFTQSLMRAAPVYAAEAEIAAGAARVKLTVVNSGQSSAGTGTSGITDAAGTVAAAAKAAGCSVRDVLVASTGIIGRRFDTGKMKASLPEVVADAGGIVEPT